MRCYRSAGNSVAHKGDAINMQDTIGLGPPRKIGNLFNIFWMFSVHGKIAWDGPKWGREDFVPTNPDLADIWGRTDLNFEFFCFCFFGSQISGFPGPQISEFLKI